MKRHGYPLSICGALAIAACSSANKDWESASAENTLFGYQTFLDRHPSDQHAEEARISMAALQDDSDWIRAQNGNSLGSYQQYLQAEPNGTYALSLRSDRGLERASAENRTIGRVGDCAAGIIAKVPAGNRSRSSAAEASGASDCLSSRARQLSRRTCRQAQTLGAAIPIQRRARRSRRRVARLFEQAIPGNVRDHGSS